MQRINIVDELFPTHAPREPDKAIEIGEIPKISEAEALKTAVRTCPQLLLDMYNGYLKQGYFYKQWKVQRLVLTSKGKGDLNSAGAYRPLCMLDTAGKLLEKIIRPRL